MSSVPPGEWDPDDTGAVPVGPEPEPTGAGGAGSGGWGEEPRTEPFAIAALVWAIVSIVLPVIGTIVAFVLAARASDSIRRSGGTRSGTGLVTAARVVAGVVIALWAIGLIVWVATRDDSTSSNVVAPTQPSTTSTTTTTLLPTTTKPLVTTTTLPATTTTLVVPTTSIAPPPSTTVAPPPTSTVAPPPTSTTTGPVTTTTTSAPTTTTSPEQAEEARIQNKLINTGSANQKIGPSNRGLTEDERVTVSYVPGQPLLITWGINNGAAPLPTGTATCTSPPTLPTTTTTTTGSTTSTTASTTSSTTTTTTLPGQPSTQSLSRTEARKILNALRADINSGRLDVDGVQLVGTFPIQGEADGEVVVVQAYYSNADVVAVWPASKAFVAPPANVVQCLNPAFD